MMYSKYQANSTKIQPGSTAQNMKVSIKDFFNKRNNLPNPIRWKT